MFKINFHKIKIKDIQTHHQVNLGWVGLGGQNTHPKIFYTFVFTLMWRGFYADNKKAYSGPLYNFKSNPYGIYNSQ